MREVDPVPKWKRWRGTRVQRRVDTTAAPNLDLQPALPLAPERPLDKEDLTIEQRFLDWCTANPNVLGMLRQMALARAAAGDTRISTKALIEDLRRSPMGRATAGDRAGERYQINNVFTSRIARVLADDPRLAGLIELRRLTAE